MTHGGAHRRLASPACARRRGSGPIAFAITSPPASATAGLALAPGADRSGGRRRSRRQRLIAGGWPGAPARWRCCARRSSSPAPARASFACARSTRRASASSRSSRSTRARCCSSGRVRAGSRTSAAVRLESGPARGAKLLAVSDERWRGPGRAGHGRARPRAGEAAAARRGLAASTGRRTCAGAASRTSFTCPEIEATGARRGGIAGAVDSARRRAERRDRAGLPPDKAALMRGHGARPGRGDRPADARRLARLGARPPARGQRAERDAPVRARAAVARRSPASRPGRAS